MESGLQRKDKPGYWYQTHAGRGNAFFPVEASATDELSISCTTPVVGGTCLILSLRLNVRADDSLTCCLLSFVGPCHLQRRFIMVRSQCRLALVGFPMQARGGFLMHCPCGAIFVINSWDVHNYGRGVDALWAASGRAIMLYSMDCHPWVAQQKASTRHKGVSGAY